MSEALKETKFLMKKYKIKANKSLGQNFLIDDIALQDIADGAEICEDDLVIEIGPGLGSLTKLLLEKAKKVICIELDKKMVKILKDRFIAYKNLEIINEDVLSIDLNELIKQEREQDSNIKNVKVVANLPYYITTPIIMKLVENDLDINSITVMIQKEVAERLIAIPGTKETGAITYTMYYYCECKKIREVDNTCFIPEPEVTSRLNKGFFVLPHAGHVHQDKAVIQHRIQALRVLGDHRPVHFPVGFTAQFLIRHFSSPRQRPCPRSVQLLHHGC